MRRLVGYRAVILRLLLASAVVVAAAAGKAPGARVERGLYNFNSIGLSWNPLGLLVDNRLTWRVPLSSKEGPLWESTKFDVGLQSAWTPADELLGLRLSLEPIGFFSITGCAYFFGLYNGLGYGMYAFDSPGATYNPTITGEMNPGSASGAWLSAAPELKAKVGRLIAVNTATVNAIFLGAEKYFVELRNYSLHKTRGLSLIDDLNVLVEAAPWLLPGANYRYLRAFGTEARSHRVSAIVVTLFPGTKLGDMFAAVNGGYYLADPAFGRSVYVGGMVGMEACLGQRRTGNRIRAEGGRR